MKRISARAFVVAIALVVCLSPAVPVPAEDTQVILETDIVYSRRGARALMLDVARPSAAGDPRPAVLFLHNVAGWDGTGRKEDMRSWIGIAPRRGYVGVAVGWTTPIAGDPSTAFPVPVHDVKAAIRWLRANCARFGIDPDRIAVAGGGFGGYLALMAALTGPRDQLEGEGALGEYSSSVQAAVAAGALVDFAAAMLRTGANSAVAFDVLTNLKVQVAALLGATPDAAPESYRRADPTRYLGFPDAPVLAIFGGADPCADGEQARRLLDAMVDKAGRHAVTVLTAATFRFVELASPQTDYPMWSFFDKMLLGK